jgi:hypothetical protein
LFEKCFILKVNNFLKKHNVIIAEQHGFTQNRSTTTALFSFLNGIYEKLDQQERVSGVFYDLSKAFDLVNHDTLLEKIEKWGLRGLANSWIKSYLTNRKEKVEIYHAFSNGTRSVSSRTVTSTCGVVQGSVLGPFLFTLFINDMVIPREAYKLVLYADDISLLIAHKEEKGIADKVRVVSSKIYEWAELNNLMVNCEKTSVLGFYNRIAQNHIDSVDLKLRKNETIKEIKLLGLILDPVLKWSAHIDNLANRISSYCYLLRRLRTSCDTKTLKMVYCAYIHSLCSYGIIFWGNSSSSNRILRMQKIAIRNMMGLRRQESCVPYFRSLRILTVTALYIYSCYEFVIKNNAYFINGVLGEHNLRPRDKIKIPQHNTSKFKQSPIYRCLFIYNSLPPYFRKKENHEKSLRRLKEELLDRAPYTLDDFLLARRNSD